MIDPVELKRLMEGQRKLNNWTAIVKRAVEGFSAQPKRGVMPWEQAK